MITVIVSTYNRSAELRRMLLSLEACERPHGESWELIVVDNNSADDTASVLAEFSGRSQLPLRPLFEGRQGKSYALNRAIRVAAGDVLAFTDDDVRVDSSWLAAIERAATRHPDALGFGGRIIADWQTPPPAWLGTGTSLGRTTGGVVAHNLGEAVLQLKPGVRPPAGANFFFRRAAFERHGLFREDLGPGTGTHGEDTEFVKRLVTAGERLLYVPDVVLQHPVAPERVRRRYGLRWHFRLGRAAARGRGRRPNWRMIRGLPLFTLRRLIDDVARFLVVAVAGTSFARHDALQAVTYRVGVFYEYVSMPRSFDPTHYIPRLAPAGHEDSVKPAGRDRREIGAG